MKLYIFLTSIILSSFSVNIISMNFNIESSVDNNDHIICPVKFKKDRLLKENGSKHFRDKFTNTDILAEITTEVSSDRMVDDIIYFKFKNQYFKRIYQYLTPEMFGAKGDGVSDDYKPIQMMLDKGKLGCTFYFDGKKTYYNAFKNNGKWRKPSERYTWRRLKGATFLFNGAKLRRRKPEWNNKNNKDEYNQGDFYTDDHTALLHLSGNGFIIENADFSSNIPLGTLLDEDGKPTKITDYAVGSCLDMGLWLENCKNVTVKNSKFSNSVFPILVENSENAIFENIYISYAAQANKRIHSKDQALGGGIKLLKSQNIKILNITGYKNLNDTVEIENLNSDITVTGKSEYDYANGLVIISSKNIKIDWYSKNIIHGTGVIIKSTVPNDVPTRNITGKIKVDGASWCGVLIWLDKKSSNDIGSIQLDVETINTGYTGLFINNENTDKIINDVNISHRSDTDGLSTGMSRIFNNTITGNITGEDNPSSNFAAKITGVNKSEKPLSLNIKSKDKKLLKYDISKESKVTIK